MRISFDEIYMRMAKMLSNRSTCARLSVGCVITSDDYRYVYGVGYNGNAAGLPNMCDSTVPGSCGCLHAEENAIINCVAPRYAPKFVFCTNLPCKMCAKRLINLGGVVRVVYRDDYRLQEGKQLIEVAGIKIEQLSMYKGGE